MPILFVIVLGRTCDTGVKVLVVRGLRPPSRKMESIYSLSLCFMNWIKIPVDLLGTVDNSRYRRSVGVSCPSIFRSLTIFKRLLSTF